MKKFLTLFLFSAYALSLFGQKEQWADSVIAFSSEYSPFLWSANQVLGAPNVYPACGDNVYAWASTTPDDIREFIVVHFAVPAPPQKIEIYETYNGGAIDTVYVRDHIANTWTIVYTATATPAFPACQILTIDVTGILFNIDAIRIAINSPAVAGWNEIDAIKLTSPPPVVSIANKSIFEGNAGLTKIKLNVTLNYPSDSVVSVKFNTMDGTATLADNDYLQILSKKITFNPGQTKKNATIGIVGDTINELINKFYVVLNTPLNCTLGITTGTGTIKNDDVLKTNAELAIIHPTWIWPNPVSEILHIEGLSSADTNVDILDIQGRSMLSKISNNLNSELNVSMLDAGIYLLSYFDGSKINLIKFIVE